MITKEIITPPSCREILHPEIATIRVYPTPEATSEAAAGAIAGIVEGIPNARITYATGNTMVPVYENLARYVREGKVSFKDTSAFHLDEYLGLNPYHPNGFVYFLRKRVFRPLGIRNAKEMNGATKEPIDEAGRYDKLLSVAPIDLAILGIGPGAHIAFNEPGTPFSLRTHIADLSEATLTRDRSDRGQKTPEKAITQGIANILEAKNILLIAYGKEKGRSLRDALYGSITPQVPASALRAQGQKVRIFIDEAATS